jgi:SAM-dependent methyltransferase
MSNTDSKQILDLGCGKKKKTNAIGIDFNERTDADIIHDLNIFPYPLEDNTYDDIYIDNTLEHLDNVIAVMEEVHRVCKRGGIVKIMVPYFRSAWASIDPTHQHYFTANSFAYFDPDNLICEQYSYSTKRFKIKRIRFNEGLENGLLKRVIKSFANHFPIQYEFKLSQFFPLDELTFTLEKI